MRKRGVTIVVHASRGAAASALTAIARQVATAAALTSADGRATAECAAVALRADSLCAAGGLGTRDRARRGEDRGDLRSLPRRDRKPRAPPRARSSTRGSPTAPPALL